MKLSERLSKIAEMIPDGARVADIGTDHGYLPIFLAETGKARHVILTDVNQGPLDKAVYNISALLKGDALRALEKPRSLMPVVVEDQSLKGRTKAKLTGEKQYKVQQPDDEWDVRKGSGLEPIAEGEADVAVIAGMGGYLIREILEKEPEKTASVKLFILQPRTEEGMLRTWLKETGWGFYKDVLVREGTFLCQIIAVVPPALTDYLEKEKKFREQEQKSKDIIPDINDNPEKLHGKQKTDRLFPAGKPIIENPLPETRKEETLREVKRLCAVLSYQVSPFWFSERDPLTKEYLERMLMKKESIRKVVQTAKSEASGEKILSLETEIVAIRALLVYL